MSDSWLLGGYDGPHGAHWRGRDGGLALARNITLVPGQSSPQLFLQGKHRTRAANRLASNCEPHSIITQNYVVVFISKYIHIHI